MSLSYMDELNQLSDIMSPAYQERLFVIENAMRETGALSDDIPTAFPTDFDEKLLTLIDSVALE